MSMRRSECNFGATNGVTVMVECIFTHSNGLQEIFFRHMRVVDDFYRYKKIDFMLVCTGGGGGKPLWVGAPRTQVPFTVVLDVDERVCSAQYMSFDDVEKDTHVMPFEPQNDPPVVRIGPYSVKGKYRRAFLLFQHVGEANKWNHRTIEEDPKKEQIA